MKKLIAILAIAIVLVGAVFAAETHTLRVKSDVGEVLPAFNLFHVEGTDTNSSATNVVDLTTPGSYTSVTTVTDTNFNLDAGGSFSVVAEVINAVKTNKGYTLTFKGGVFQVTRNTIAGYLSPNGIAVVNGAANDAIKVFGTPENGENNTITADTTDTLSATTSVTFSGKTGDVSTNPITIATATYSYTADTSIDPSSTSTKATNGFYTADIVLEITAL